MERDEAVWQYIKSLRSEININKLYSFYKCKSTTFTWLTTWSVLIFGLVNNNKKHATFTEAKKASKTSGKDSAPPPGLSPFQRRVYFSLVKSSIRY